MELAIETALHACSAALIEGGRVVADRHEIIARGHAERLVPLVAELLADAGVRRADGIVVDVGPGSFTGIRVGIAAAQGLSIGWQVPLAAFSSLSLIAAAARAEAGSDAPVLAAMPGGHGELFVQAFGAIPLAPIGEARSLSPADAAALADPDTLLAGPAAQALADAGAPGTVQPIDPLARHAALLPAALAALPPLPLYVRAPDAKPKAA